MKRYFVLFSLMAAAFSFAAAQAAEPAAAMAGHHHHNHGHGHGHHGQGRATVTAPGRRSSARRPWRWPRSSLISVKSRYNSTPSHRCIGQGVELLRVLMYG